MTDTELSYGFKEVFDRFERDVRDDLKEIKGDVRDLRDGQASSAREIAEIKGKMVIYGSLSIILGTAIASLVVKWVG